MSEHSLGKTWVNSCSESIEGDFDQQWGQNHIIWSLPDFEGKKRKKKGKFPIKPKKQQKSSKQEYQKLNNIFI